MFVSGHPRHLGPGVQGAGDHLGGQGGFRRECDVLADPGGGTAIRGIGPGLRQVQGSVHKRMTRAGGIRQIDADLRVLDPTRSAGVVPLHPHRLGALLQIAGLVHDQHRLVVAQVVHHIAAQVVTDSVGIPDRTGQQMLQTIRARVAGMLGDGPTILPRQLRHQAQQQLPRMSARLDPRETVRDPAGHLIEHRLPPGRAYAGTRGRQPTRIGPHNPS